MLRRSFVLGLLMAGMMGNALAIEIPQDQVPEIKRTENAKFCLDLPIYSKWSRIWQPSNGIVASKIRKTSEFLGKT